MVTKAQLLEKGLTVKEVVDQMLELKDKAESSLW